MSAISILLARIKSAVYGEEVRGSIHDAIEQCYEDVTNAKTLADNSINNSTTALNNANNAVSAANAAQRTADNAIADVTAARDATVQAKDDAVAAKTDAETAKADAIAAKNAAEEAQEAAEQAKDNVTQLEASVQQAKMDIETTLNETYQQRLQEYNDNANAALQTAEEEFDVYIEGKLDEFDDNATAKNTELNNIKSRADTQAANAVNIAQNANTQSLQAIEKATNVENESAEVATKVDKISTTVDAAMLQVQQSPDGAFVENGVAYFTRNGEVLFSITGIGGGGGGGGGGAVTPATMEMKNTSGWNMTTVAKGDSCVVHFRWSSLEDELPTGPGSMRVMVNNSIRFVDNAYPQGEDCQVDVGPYLSSGTNSIAIYVADIYGQERIIRCTVIAAVFELTSSFDSSTPYSGAILVPYTPTGSTSKTMHFIVDDVEIGTVVTSVSGRQQSYTIPQQPHGAHTLRMYFEGELNGQVVRSNELYFEITCIDPLSDTPVITSSYRNAGEKQYDTMNIPYSVYNPAALKTDIVITVDGTTVSELTVERTTQMFSYRWETSGNHVVAITTGTPGNSDYARKEWTIAVEAVNIDVTPETEALALYLSSNGRSNAEALEARQQWKYNDISATLTGFNWRINGWMNDEDGITVLRLNDTARATIPYQIFGTDFKAEGKTIEVEFATRDVVDYGATILSCEEGGVGLKITPQNVYFNGAQTKISTPYKENEHIRVGITVEKQSDFRLIMVYINGIASSAIRYASGERFSQLNPVGITIGSDLCGIDIYNIRVYDQALTSRQMVDNWIADTQLGSLMQERYNRNHIYSETGDVTPNTLPSNLPYMVITGVEQPQYKGDKKTVSGRYIDPVDSSKSFTFKNCQINVQGTSSSIYYRKNWDMQFKEGFTMSNGTEADNYALRNGSIPFNRFVLKANVASSEGVNNTAGVMLYNDLCPYKTAEMEDDARVRWGIEGVPIVVFWENPDTNTLEFLGQHMFNLPKRAPAPYGYSTDGSDESWEFERNNSDNMKFKTFDTTSKTWDEVKQEYYPTWYDDWEARFPSDEWRNTDKLGEFVRWVASTNREAATNENLPSRVTYTLPTRSTLNAYPDDTSYSVQEIGEGSSTQYRIVFTKDTPAYRLTKFRAEAAQYMELEAFEFYYIFTEQFLMIDSRAKNLFVGTHGGRITEG